MEKIFEIDKGCTFGFALKIQNNDGTGFIPASGSKVIFTMRLKNTNTVVLTQELDLTENAEYETELTATQTSAFATGRYEFDIVYTEDNNTVYKVFPTSLIIVKDTVSDGRIWT